MCIKVNEEDLVTIHHELGHDYYFQAYYRLGAGEAALRRPPLLRAAKLQDVHGKDRIPDKAPSRRTCWATCGRRSGATSTRWWSRTPA